jgi:centrosomal protein CEP104
VSCTQALLTALASSGSGRDVAQAVEIALPVLLERLSDNNSRLRDSARDALVALAQEPEGRGALRSQASALCKPPRNQTAWRPVLAMLQLLQELVPLLGVVSSGSGGRHSSTDSGSGGFDLQVCVCLCSWWTPGDGGGV